MKLLSVTIDKFGSFKTKQRFDFPDTPGLYFMQGLNKAEPELGENGAGKTTVWKAITWCIFGKDPRGLKAGDVMNWDDPKGAKVSITFEHEEAGTWMQYVVERTHAPNSWKLYNTMDAEPIADLAKDDTNELYAMLRLDFEPFLNCVLMAQGEPMFLDMKSEPQAALFSRVLGLDNWLDYSKRAADLQKDADAKLRELEREESALRGQIEALARSNVSGDAELWVEQKNGRLEHLADLHRTAVARSKELKEEWHDRNEDIAFADGKLREALFTVTAHEGEVDKARNKERSEQSALDVLDADAARLKKTIDGLKDAKECPTCGTDGVHLAGHVKKHKDELLRIEQSARDVYGYLQAAKRKAAEAVNALAGAKEALRVVQERHIEYTRDVSDARRAYDLCERDLDRIEDEAERVTAEVNPHERQQQRQAEERAECADRLAEVQAKIKQAAARYEKLGFWIRGFKDIRLQLIGEALQQLDIEVNSEVTGLGLVDWSLGFEIDKETKSGGVSRGFSVYVKSPHNDQRVPWAAWSGGEAQRLRVAAQMGFGNLIRATTGADIPLEVWDEPTAGLNARGVAGLLDTLSQRAKSERRQIWVVDHRSHGFGGFNGGVTVIKEKRGGSKFEVQ